MNTALVPGFLGYETGRERQLPQFPRHGDTQPGSDKAQGLLDEGGKGHNADNVEVGNHENHRTLIMGDPSNRTGLHSQTDCVKRIYVTAMVDREEPRGYIVHLGHR